MLIGAEDLTTGAACLSSVVNMETITNRLEFPRAATPGPDFNLDITNRTPFDNFDDGFMGVHERTGE